MSEFVLDLSNYKDRRGSRVPEGQYKVKPIDVEETTSQNGNRMLNVIFEITEGEFAGNTLVDRYMLDNERVQFRIVSLMQAINLPTPRKRVAVKFAMMLNRPLLVTVQDGDPYQGLIRSEIRGWERLPESAQSNDNDDWMSDDTSAWDADNGATYASEEQEQVQSSRPKVRVQQQAAAADAGDDEDEVDLDSLPAL